MGRSNKSFLRRPRGGALIDEERGRLRVSRLDPIGEEVALVRLIPQVLVQVGVRDLLQRLYLIDGDEVGVEVHELDGDLLEGALREQVALDARERLMRVVIRLLHQAQLLTLLLVQPRRHGVLLLQPLQRLPQGISVSVRHVHQYHHQRASRAL